MISANIMSFPTLSQLQKGVLSILSNLLTTSADLEEYIKAFELLDLTHDGCISIDEMKKGLKLMPHLKDLVISEEQWDKITEAMDTNGD